MDEFVVCPSCGTRIKAGREFCLRCFEPLPTRDRPVRLPVWVSLGMSGRTQLVLGAVASLIVIALVAIIWQTQPAQEDDTARPAVVQPAVPRPAAPSPSTTQSTDTVSPELDSVAPYEPTEFLDAETGDAAGAAGDFESARASDEKTLEKQPNDAQALNGLGQALVRLGRVGEAIKPLERAIAAQPGNWAYHFNLARALSALRRWTPAIVEFHAAARLAPGDYPTQYDLGLALHKRGDEHDAVAEFQKAIVLAPNAPNAHLALGVSLERVNRIPDAVREYRRFLELAPEAVQADPVRTHVEALSTGQATGGRAP